jgi:predicted Zn-dependent peptidase
MSSRLFQEIRERRGLCYSIFVQTGAYADTGMSTIYAGTSGEKIRELAEITVDEMKRAADDMSEAEVARAKAQMRAGLLMAQESASSRAERLAQLVSIWGRVPTVEETLARIDAVGTAAVRDFAAQVAGQGTGALALYGPAGDAPPLADILGRLAA